MDVPTWRIPSGVSSGIEIHDHPKHWAIDPEKYQNPRQLKRMTDPYGRGSKWLPHVTREQRFTFVRQVLEAAGVALDGPPGTYSATVSDEPIGISDGVRVRSVEVQFYGRYAHGYPCAP